MADLEGMKDHLDRKLNGGGDGTGKVTPRDVKEAADVEAVRQDASALLAATRETKPLHFRDPTGETGEAGVGVPFSSGGGRSRPSPHSLSIGLRGPMG